MTHHEPITLDLFAAAPSDDAFLQAWKRGLALSVNPALFGGRGLKLSQVKHRHYLQPDIKAISTAIGRCSKSQGAFLVAMVSFYNPEAAARLGRKIGIGGFADIAIHLTEAQRTVIAALLIHYSRW